MDREQFYRAEVLFEDALLMGDRLSMEALGLLIQDIIGSATQVAGLACIPTTPASLAVKVGPGRIYKQSTLEASPIGVRVATGGLTADTATDHMIMKQGLLRDTQTFNITPPVTVGQSQVFLIEAQFQEADDAAVATQIYNSANPNAPTTENLSPARRCICALQMKPGTAATTGTQSAPSADAGWVPVWAITVAHSDTSIAGGAIVQAAGAPVVTIGSGPGTGTTLWTTVNSAYTATAGDKLIGDTSGGAFTVTLPAAPVADSSTVRVKGNFATNNLTLAGNGHNFDLGALGTPSTFVLNADNVDVMLVFDGTRWRD